jgi:hypothetical protein
MHRSTNDLMGMWRRQESRLRRRCGATVDEVMLGLRWRLDAQRPIMTLAITMALFMSGPFG